MAHVYVAHDKVVGDDIRSPLRELLAAERGWEALTAGATPEAARAATQAATARRSGPETPKAAPKGGLAELTNLWLDLPDGVYEDADCSKPLMVDLAGGLSKLVPPLGYMRSLHRTIRSRAGRPTQRESAPASAHRSIGSETLDTLERRYHDGEALRAIANDVGMSRHRLASLLRGEASVSAERLLLPQKFERWPGSTVPANHSNALVGAWGSQLARFGTTCSPPA